MYIKFVFNQLICNIKRTVVQQIHVRTAVNVSHWTIWVSYAVVHCRALDRLAKPVPQV